MGDVLLLDEDKEETMVIDEVVMESEGKDKPCGDQEQNSDSKISKPSGFGGLKFSNVEKVGDPREMGGGGGKRAHEEVLEDNMVGLRRAPNGASAEIVVDRNQTHESFSS
ncbi:hypothetical protein L1987_48794 [Smallanthus sonchifolius]|uniref:Uncharacterized protein n=1 Tax=Smallanthus sonchifolius TaxID=185202 RepID=A0ACB9FSZ4_9ASTR|nr:hypothetical protein L1987_48794 [Smallanthus sonchifolius]